MAKKITTCKSNGKDRKEFMVYTKTADKAACFYVIAHYSYINNYWWFESYDWVKLFHKVVFKKPAVDGVSIPEIKIDSREPKKDFAVVSDMAERIAHAVIEQSPYFNRAA